MKKLQRFSGEWLILLVVALALFMRLWPVGYTRFGTHDQEIPTLAYRFIHRGVLPLFGYEVFTPDYGHYGPASVYLFLPFALISPSPLMATFFPAGLSAAAVYVLYRIGRDFWNPGVGWIAALLYATSHFSGVMSRLPKTANLAPLFVAVYLYSILALLKERRTLHYVLLFVSMGIILQLHIVEFTVLLLILPALLGGARIGRKQLIIGTSILFLLFLPYLYYEASNGFLETRQRFELISGIGSAGSPLHLSIDSTSLRSYVSPSALNQKAVEQNNPFILEILGMGIFCQNPPDDSLLMTHLIPLGDMLLALAWLMFIVVPFLSIAYLVTRRRKTDGLERKALSLVLLWFLSALMFISFLGGHNLRYLNGFLLSIILLYSVGWGWLIPSLAGPLKGNFRRFVLGFVLLLVFVNTMTWTTAHLNNPKKDCITHGPPLTSMMKIAEVLARDQRLRPPNGTAENLFPLIYSALQPIFFNYGGQMGAVHKGMAYVVQAASHQREQRGEQFLNLTGRYLLIQQHSLPFALDPSQEITQIGSYLLVRYEPIINTTHWYITNSEELLGEEWAKSRGNPRPMPINTCVGGCPPNTVADKEGLNCLRQTRAYMMGYLGRNTSPKTALVIKDQDQFYDIGEVYLNSVPLFRNNTLLVPGRRGVGEEILLDITGLLLDEQNLLEVLLFTKPECPPSKLVEELAEGRGIVVFTISGI